MAEPIADYRSFFEGAKTVISETEALKKEEEQLKEQENRERADLEAEKRALKETIDSTLKKRVSEISTAYDTQISKANEEMKRASSRRERAKNLGMKERIKEETKPYLEENRALKKEAKELFQKNGVPGIFRTRLYYALYFPHKFSQFLVLLLFIAICFAAIPCGIYFLLLPEAFRRTFFLILIYIADIVVFGGLYTAVGSASKVHYLDSLKAGREILDKIAANRKTVKKIARSISRDKSEDKYDLASYDDEIAKIRQNLDEAKQKKQEALNQFETVTKQILTDELTQNARPRIEQLESAHSVTLRKLQETSRARQEKSLEASDKYEVYLGREFMTEERIDALAQIMEAGTAVNLSDAIGEFRREQDEQD